jgi:hypothetical protein
MEKYRHSNCKKSELQMLLSKKEKRSAQKYSVSLFKKCNGWKFTSNENKITPTRRTIRNGQLLVAI